MRLQEMSEEQMDILPAGYLKKFGSFVMKIEEMH